MNITLCDLNSKLCAEWERAFAKIPNVNIKNGDIFSFGKFDAIASPSNSYLFFDGGIDQVYTNHFGKLLQERGQRMVKQLPMRELLVGQTLLIPTDNKDIPYVISAPTMKVPLNISNGCNPYLAFKAILICAKENDFKNIICPGLGTATGMVESGDAARQMYSAYADVFDKYPSYPNSIREAYLNFVSLVGQTNIKGRK